MRRTLLLASAVAAATWGGTARPVSGQTSVAARPAAAQMPGPARPAGSDATEPRSLDTASTAPADRGWQRALAEAVARAWRVPTAEVRVLVAGELPAAVDSLEAAPAGAERFLVTAWSGDDVVRRFADAEHLATVPVAARRIARGETIDSAAVRHEARMVRGAPDGNRRSPVGLVAERVLEPGTELREPAVRPPYLVRGGETVEATLTRSGLVMTVRGEALGSAREGELVFVRLPSGLRLEARARAPGRVTLLPGAP